MKKRKMFLASLVVPSLVATTVTPTVLAAGFTDTKGNTHEVAINALVREGIINGYPDGTFKPNKTLTRSDVVKLLGKYLVAKGFKVPTDYKTKVRFTDVTVKTADDELLKYAAMIKDNRILGGSNGRLLAKENMTREDMAIAIVKLLNVAEGVDLIKYESSQTYVSDVTDLKSAKVAARPFIEVLDYFNITNPDLDMFHPKDTTTRGQFATFLKRSIELDLTKVKEKSITIASFKPVGNQELTLTFNKEIDLKKASFAIRKNGLNVGISKISQSTDKKTVSFKLLSQLSAGSYEISVSGLSDKVLTSNVSITNERVETIEIRGNQAVPYSDGTILRIPFKVYNQYKEDITNKTNNLKVSSNLASSKHSYTIDSEKGFIEVSKLAWNEQFKVGEKFTLTLESGNIKGDKLVTVSQKSKVSQVEILNVYNDVSTRETLSLNSDYEDFHLVLNAIDEYGLPVPASDIANGVTLSISGTSIIDVNGGRSTPKFSELTINGKKQTVLELREPVNKKAGQATITITSRATGKSAKFNITVANGAKADKITMQRPNLVVAGEKTEIPFVVNGTDGKVINDANFLNSSSGMKLTTNDSRVKATFETDQSTGKAKLYVTDSSQLSTDRQVTINATTPAGKLTSLTLTIRAKAEATKIIGVTNLKTSLMVNETIMFKPDSFRVNDQYNRAFNLVSNMARAANTSNSGKYLIKVESADDKLMLSSNNTISASNTVTATGVKNGKSNLKFYLQQIDSRGNVKELNMRQESIQVNEGTTYQVDIKPIYDNPVSSEMINYKREIIVSAITSNGVSTVLPTSAYDVIPSNPDLVYEKATNRLYVRPDKDIVDKGDKTENVKVVIKTNPGEVTLNQSVTITKAAPNIEKMELHPFNNLTIIDGMLRIPGTTTGTVPIDSIDLLGVLKVIDQYGEDITPSVADKIKMTATDLVNSDNDNIKPEVTENGIANLQFSGIENGDSFDLTYIVNGKSFTTKVLIQ